MSDNGTEFNTPVGRIVWGHPLKPQDKTDDNNQKVLKDGVPIKRWAWGVAIPKADFERDVWPHLFAEASKGYPQGVPPTFSYKYKDGDDPAPTWNNGKQGKPLAERPGHQGCYILSVSTELAPPSVVRFDKGFYHQIQAEQIKTGDYIAMTVIAKWHAGQSPGLYINPGVIVQAFEGDAIDTGGFDIDPTKSFGAAPQFAMPAGARPLGSAPPPAAGGSTVAPGGMPGAPGGMPGAPGLAPPAALTPPPVAPPAGPQRPTDPTHIHAPGTAGEQWYINGAWTPAPAPVTAPPPPPVAGPVTLPPPATGFASPGGMPAAPSAGMPGQMPGR